MPHKLPKELLVSNQQSYPDVTPVSQKTWHGRHSKPERAGVAVTLAVTTSNWV